MYSNSTLGLIVKYKTKASAKRARIEGIIIFFIVYANVKIR